MIRRQAAMPLAQAHAAARGMKANAHLLRGADLIFQLHIIGKDIVMVAGGRAAGKQQFGHGQPGGGIDMFRSHLRPQRITSAQPAEEVFLLPHHARQALKHMVMRIDQARQHDVIGKINDAIGIFRRRLVGRPEALYDAVANQQPGALPVRALHHPMSPDSECSSKKRRHRPATPWINATNIIRWQMRHKIQPGQAQAPVRIAGHFPAMRRGNQEASRLRRAAFSVFDRSMVMVIGPTPPGTLVM